MKKPPEAGWLFGCDLWVAVLVALNGAHQFNDLFTSMKPHHGPAEGEAYE